MKKYKQAIFLLLIFLIVCPVLVLQAMGQKDTSCSGIFNSSLQALNFPQTVERTQKRDGDWDRKGKIQETVYEAEVSHSSDKSWKRNKRIVYSMKDLSECQSYSQRLFWKPRYTLKEKEALKKKEQPVSQNPLRAPPYFTEETA